MTITANRSSCRICVDIVLCLTDWEFHYKKEIGKDSFEGGGQLVRFLLVLSSGIAYGQAVVDSGGPLISVVVEGRYRIRGATCSELTSILRHRCK